MAYQLGFPTFQPDGRHELIDSHTSEMPGAFPAENHHSHLEYLADTYELSASGEISDDLRLSSHAGPVADHLFVDSPRPVLNKDAPRTAPKPTTTAFSNGANQVAHQMANQVAKQAPKKPKPAAAGTFAIVVFGLTGTGKSSFINTLTGAEVEIGHDLQSCTAEIKEVPHQFGGLNIMLVDTPGFSDTTRSDTDVLREIGTWMKEAYDEKVQLVGVIYLHRITDNRMSGTSRLNLQMLRSLCGANNLSNVILASTMWDGVDKETGDRREKELFETKNFWGQLRQHGAKAWRYDSTRATATAMVLYLLRKSPVVLKIQHELAVEKKSLIETAAGQWINDALNRLEQKHNEELAAIKEEMIQARRENDHRLQLELEELRKDLDEQRREVEENRRKLRIPINTRKLFAISWKCIECATRLEKTSRGPEIGSCPRCGLEQQFV